MKSQFKNLLQSVFVALILGGIGTACSKEESTTPSTPPPTTPPVTYKQVIPEGWKALQVFADQRNCATAIVIGEKIYAGLGYNGSSGYSSVMSDWNEYDPATNKWTRKAEFPGTPRANAFGFSINGKAYVGMGTNYDRSSRWEIYSDVYEYDPVTDKWTKKKDFTGIGRDQSVYFTIGNKGYMGTGNPDPRLPNVIGDFWEYDATKDTWTQKANLSGQARCRSFGFGTSTHGYLGAGENNVTAKLKDFFRYDPATDKWEQMGDFPDPNSRSKGFTFNDNGYVIGGLRSADNSAVNTLYKFDTKANTWISGGEIAVESNQYNGRFYQIAVATKTKAYIGAGGSGVGTSPRNHNDFYEYLPK
jgi:N-acetylneuraminic acid mutarotase